LKNQQLVARRMRTEADENQYKEQEQARQVMQKEQRLKIKQKKEDDHRIQNVIDVQRDEVRQKKLGKALEWDQDKPTLDEDDALPTGQRFYHNYSRHGRDSNIDGGRRGGRDRYGGSRGRGTAFGVNQGSQPKGLPATDNVESWPALPAPDSSKETEK